MTTPFSMRAFVLIAALTGGSVLWGEEARPDMIRVAGGTYVMGSTVGDSDEVPLHTVTVSTFWMARTKVTQRLYKTLVRPNPSKYVGNTLPVESVSWLEAVAFCNALSLAEGLKPVYTIRGRDVAWDRSANGYRLPTEAEWEWAARSGDKVYAGSSDPDVVGWFDENAKGKTHPVAQKLPNPLGFFDLCGDVWEWCWDWYGPYSADTQADPVGPDNGTFRAGRGGTYRMGDYAMRVTNRVRLGTEGYRASVAGFRLVRNGS